MRLPFFSGKRIKFLFKWYQHKSVRGKWVAVVESEPLPIGLLNRIVKGLNSDAIRDSWFDDARIGDKKLIELGSEQRLGVLKALPKHSPRGKNVLVRELKEMWVKRVKDGFVFVFYLSVIIEL